MCKFFGGDQVEIHCLGKVLPEEAIRILVRSALPRVVRICKVHCRAGFLLETFPVAEFHAIVEGDRRALLARDALKVFMCESREQLRVHLRQEECNEVSGSAIDKRNDTNTLVPSHERVTLEITDTSSTIHDLRPLIDPSLLGLFTSLFSDLGSSLATVLSLARSQEHLEVWRTLREVPVYGACGEWSLLSPEDTGDLFGRFVQLQFFRDEPQQCSTNHANAFHCSDTLHSFLSAHLTRIVSVSSAVFLHMSPEGALVFTDGSCNFGERVSCSQHPRNA